MTYLYGDSTDSGLELNYIELLRAFLDFAVQVMLSEHRIAGAKRGAEDAKREASAELERLRALGNAVAATLESHKRGDAGSATDASIASIRRATDDTLRRAAEGLKQSVAQTESSVLASRGREHAGNSKLIEPLLLGHELPDSESVVNVELDAEGQSYAAQVVGSCKQGLAWRFAAVVPPGHAFKETIKIAAFDPELTIALPEMSGFVRKSVKLKPYRLFPLFLTRLVHQGEDVVIRLRSTASVQDDTGIDVVVSPSSPRVSITRVQKGETSPSFDASGDDAKRLIELAEYYSKRTRNLVAQRSRLIEVTFDGQPLASCNDPTSLVKKLVQRIGPVVTKIAERSLTDSELVLKRVLDNGRREEIFASKQELLKQIEEVPLAAQWVFAPLGLGTPGIGTQNIAAMSENKSGAVVDPLAGFAGEDEEETKVPTPTSEISEIIAIAADEEEDDEKTGVADPVPRGRASVPPPAPGAKRPPLPPPPSPAAAESASTGDSIDVALAELEAD